MPGGDMPKVNLFKMPKIVRINTDALEWVIAIQEEHRKLIYELLANIYEKENKMSRELAQSANLGLAALHLRDAGIMTEEGTHVEAYRRLNAAYERLTEVPHGLEKQYRAATVGLDGIVYRGWVDSLETARAEADTEGGFVQMRFVTEPQKVASVEVGGRHA